MLINDPAIFTLLIPTFNGTPFLIRTLDYLSEIDFKGQVVVADSSAPEHRSFSETCDQKYPNLAIAVRIYPESIPFLTKMAQTLESLPARYVLPHANDDFLVPEAVEQCVQFLETSADYSAARGRTLSFHLTHQEDKGAKGGLGYHAMHGYEQADAAERVIAHVENYSSVFYSVHRREYLIESCNFTELRTKSLMFFQYLSSSVTAFLGKVHCSNELFYIRQQHYKSASWNVEYEGWPLLITSPQFSNYYAEFRNALCTLVTQGHEMKDFGRRLDKAAVNMFRRSFCGIEPKDPDEELFRKRLSNPKAPELARMKWILEFCMKYPETY